MSFEDCWAFKNGLSVDGKPLADGNGFKIGGFGANKDTAIPNPVPRHRVLRCIAAFNRASGFYANHHPGGNDWICNSAYRNGTDFNMLGWSTELGQDVDGFDHLLQGNLSYKTRRSLVRIDLARCQLEHNALDASLKLTDDQFESLDYVQLQQTRAAEGFLPAIGFLRPKQALGQSPSQPIGALEPFDSK